MAKRISKVTFTSNLEGTNNNSEMYFIQDVDELKEQGADDLVQVYALYDGKEAAKGIIGIRQGSLMNNPYERIALPCPPYCHPDANNVDRQIGELNFQEAVTRIKT